MRMEIIIDRIDNRIQVIPYQKRIYRDILVRDTSHLLEQFLILLRGSSRHQADNTQLLQQDLTEKGTIGFLLLRYGLPRFVQELTQGLQTLLHIDQTVPSVTDIDGNSTSDQ